MSVCASLIVAAGRGQRMEGAVPKQYRRLGSSHVLRHTVTQFTRNPKVDLVQVVIHHDDRDLYADAVGDLDLLKPVIGGSERQESVWLGLEALAAHGPDYVLIHDGVRPFVDQTTIDNVLDGLARAVAVVPAIQVADTIKRVGPNGTIAGTVDRSHLWGSQTPQGFHFKSILDAHRKIHLKDPNRLVATDDAQIFELLGLDVLVVPGNPDNFKITREFDLDRAQRVLLAGRLTHRVGLGYDVHPFAQGDHVMICGIAIPHDHGMARQDNCDVPLNAITDALLGTIGFFGDDGHFNPDHPQWRGGTSELFLRDAISLVANKGGRITNVDVMVICEQPKIGPYREAIQTRMRTLLGVDRDCFSIKATTNEGLGFIGRREGIGAQALATVEFPAL